MGTWASGTFDNDYAMDWVQDLLETKNLELVESTLDNVIDSDAAELESPFAAEALVAVEVIARLLGQAGDEEQDETHDDVDAWVARCKRKVNPLQVDKALTAIERILADQSELNQLWQESTEHYAEWRHGVLALAERVRAGGRNENA